jgi:hypothetical protein
MTTDYFIILRKTSGRAVFAGTVDTPEWHSPWVEDDCLIRLYGDPDHAQTDLGFLRAQNLNDKFVVIHIDDM